MVWFILDIVVVVLLVAAILVTYVLFRKQSKGHKEELDALTKKVEEKKRDSRIRRRIDLHEKEN